MRVGVRAKNASVSGFACRVSHDELTEKWKLLLVLKGLGDIHLLEIPEI